MPQDTLEQVLLARQPSPLRKAEGIRPNVGRTGVMTPEDEQRILDLVSGMGMGSLKVPFPRPDFGKLAERAGQFIRRFLPERAKPTSAPEPEVLDSRITGLHPTPAPKPAQPEMTQDKILDIVLEREQLKRKGTPVPRAQKPTPKEPEPRSKDPFSLDPKMDRRGFFRRLSGQPSLEAEEALYDLEDLSKSGRPGWMEDISVDEIAQFFGPKLASREKAIDSLYSKIINKYMNVDNPNRFAGNQVTQRLQHLKSNFMNEFYENLDDAGREALEKNPEKAADYVRSFLERIGKRFSGK